MNTRWTPPPPPEETGSNALPSDWSPPPTPLPPSAPSPVIEPMPVSSVSWMPWVVRGGGLALFLCAGFALGITLLNLSAGTGSTEDDEVATASKQQADLALWREGMRKLRAGSPLSPVDEKAESYGWWKKRFQLPNEDAVRAALRRRLPEEVRLVSIEPIRHEKTDEGMSVTYRVQLKPTASLFLVPVRPLTLDDPSQADVKHLAKYLLASEDLEAGYTYLPEAKQQIAAAKEVQTVEWTVRRAVQDEKKVWRIVDAEPIPVGRDTKLEEKLLEFGAVAEPDVVRGELQVAQMAMRRQATFDQFIARIKQMRGQVEAAQQARIQTLPPLPEPQQIQSLVSQYRKDRMASVPSSPSRDNSKFGGSGSGEPTRSAARVGGGAASGAAIGAMAGGGEGAGWGALGGLVGGLIYDAVSKSNDKKRFEQAKESRYQSAVSSRNSAVRAAEKDIASYEAGLRAEFKAAQIQRQADLAQIDMAAKQQWTELLGGYEKEMMAAAQQRSQALGLSL